MGPSFKIILDQKLVQTASLSTLMLLFNWRGRSMWNIRTLPTSERDGNIDIDTGKGMMMKDDISIENETRMTNDVINIAIDDVKTTQENGYEVLVGPSTGIDTPTEIETEIYGNRGRNGDIAQMVRTVEENVSEYGMTVHVGTTENAEKGTGTAIKRSTAPTSETMEEIEGWNLINLHVHNPKMQFLNIHPLSYHIIKGERIINQITIYHTKPATSSAVRILDPIVGDAG